MQVAVLSKNLRSMKENAVIAAPHRHMSTGAAICAF